jgi:hypothetical protein
MTTDRSRQRSRGGEMLRMIWPCVAFRSQMTGAIGRRRPKAPGLILNRKIWQFTGTLEAAMYEDPYELGSAADGYPLRIRARVGRCYPTR